MPAKNLKLDHSVKCVLNDERFLTALLWVTSSSFQHRRLPSGTSCAVSRYTYAVSRFFFTATIYRGILWPWRYWNRYVIIDDKCRGIVGIARIFFRSLRSGNSLYHISKELARWRQPPTTSKHNAFPHSNTERGDSVVLF